MLFEYEMFCLNCKRYIVKIEGEWGCECTNTDTEFDEVDMSEYMIWIPDYWRETEDMSKSKMRRFLLNRLEDETGISGEGYIAEGVKFSSGECVLNWNTENGSTGFYKSIEALISIHGHKGKTVVEWIDN